MKQKNITEKLESQFKPFTIEMVITIYISFVTDNILINIVYNYSGPSQKESCGNKLQKIYFSSVEISFTECCTKFLMKRFLIKMSFPSCYPAEFFIRLSFYYFYGTKMYL